MVFSILVPASIVAVLGVLIAAGVYVLQRVRAGEPMRLSFRTIAAAYFHLMAIACFLVLTVGLSIALKAGLSDAFGREFSYFRPPIARPVPEGPPGRMPPPDDSVERNRRDVEGQYQNDLIQGMTLAVVGAVLWGIHGFGRRQVTPEAPEVRQFFSRAHAIVLLAIFGLVGVVALPMSIYEALRFFLITSDEHMRSQSPGATVATALVFVPLWMYYLNDILARSRREASSSSAGIRSEGP